MTTTASRSTTATSRPATVSGRTYSAADAAALVEHDLISQTDLEALALEGAARGASPIDVLIQRGVYLPQQIELCLQTHHWLKRGAKEHIDLITSPARLSAYQTAFSERGWFTIPHFLPREQLYALDLALHRISLAHVERDPQRHKLYHSIGGDLLFSQRAMTDLIGHAALTNIARAFLGEDLVQGKTYLKVDDPYQFRGMFGHTHAETHFDCLNRAMYMFLYLDATGEAHGAFQIIPESHRWYTRGQDGRTQYAGKPLEAQSSHTNKASLVHDARHAQRWAGYQSLEMPGNTLLALTPFIWHAVRPVTHRRRLIFLGFFDAAALTRDFVTTSDYFGEFPYDLRTCDLGLLDQGQRRLLEIHLDREAWLRRRGL